jgi:hypothetical protein
LTDLVVIQLVESLCQLAPNKESRREAFHRIRRVDASPQLLDEFSYGQPLLPIEIYEPTAKNG